MHFEYMALLCLPIPMSVFYWAIVCISQRLCCRDLYHYSALVKDAADLCGQHSYVR